MTGRSPARLLAPIALVTSFIALYVVVTSGGSETETDGSARSAQTSTAKRRTTTTKQTTTKKLRRTYTVKPGDTPSGIADSVGISLDTLLELNPDVDPQLLSPGQRLKLSP